MRPENSEKEKNAPGKGRKRRNRVRSGCWREVQRVRTDGKTGIDRHRTCLGCRLGRFAAERHWRSLTPRHALRRGAAVPRCRVLMRANEKKRGKQMLVSLFWQGQKDLNPRHAVLEWMWESAPGSEEGTVLSSSCRKSQNGRCWFGAAGKFCGRSSSQIATDTIRQSSRICWMSTADSSFFSARAAASFSKNSRLAEMISFTLR